MYQHIVIYNNSTYLLTEPWAQVLGGQLQKTRILVPGGDAGHTEHSTPHPRIQQLHHSNYDTDAQSTRTKAEL